MLRRLLELAAEEGHRKVILNAQADVVEFYRKHGFRPVGDVFMEAGIPHQCMMLDLAPHGGSAERQ